MTNGGCVTGIRDTGLSTPPFRRETEAPVLAAEEPPAPAPPPGGETLPGPGPILFAGEVDLGNPPAGEPAAAEPDPELNPMPFMLAETSSKVESKPTGPPVDG